MNHVTAHPSTRNQLRRTPPHPAATAPATEGAEPGDALAKREEVARQVARLRTIEDVRALGEQAGEDYRAGIINDHIFHRAIEVARLANLELSAAVVVKGCPSWCNAHRFAYGDAPGEDVNLHRHLVQGDGWLVELEVSESGEVGPVHFIDAAGVHVPLGEARAYAVALVAACDAIEATR